MAVLVCHRLLHPGLVLVRLAHPEDSGQLDSVSIQDFLRLILLLECDDLIARNVRLQTGNIILSGGDGQLS